VAVLSRYRNVQGLRALSALAVVVGHADIFGLIDVPQWLAACGIGGADIFFVISGFIICQITIPDRGESGSGQAALFFLLRRCVRIYPLYWTVLATVAIASLWFPLRYPLMSCHEEIGRYVLLIGGNCLVPTAWTLQYELYFYTVVAALLFSVPRTFYAALSLLMLAQAAYVALSGFAVLPQGFPSSPVILEFGAGCAISWLHDRGFRKWPVGALLLGVLVFSLGSVQAMDADLSPLQRVLTFGSGGALILYALVALEANAKVILSGPIEALGDASYSLYLWHWPLLAIFTELALGWYGMAAIVAFSFVSYRLVEIPLKSLGRSFRASRIASSQA